MDLSHRAIAIAALVISSAHVTLAADQKPNVAFVRHHLDGWNMAPAVHNGRIVGFLGWEAAGEAQGGNIELIWLERGNGSTWTAWGWSSDDKGAAVNWVRQQYGDPTMFGRDGTLVVASQHGVVTAPTDKLDGAFFESDPMAAAVNGSPDAAAIAETLSSAGYQVTAGQMAAALSTQPCDAAVSTTDKMMNPTARQVEDALFTAESLAEERAGTEPAPCAAWPCSGCTAAYGPMTPVPGATTSTTITQTLNGARCKCESRTPATAPVSYTGLTWFLCNSCPAAGTADGHEYCAEDIECPVPLTAAACPGGGCGVFVPD